MAEPPRLIYVPGLLPKPEPALHRDALFRCLAASLQRVQPELTAEIDVENFAVAAWTYDFYGQHRDYQLDATAIDAVIEQVAPTDEDRSGARSFTRRLARVAYWLGDLMPFLIPHLANERLALHLRDLHRYVKNVNGAAQAARDLLKSLLLQAPDRPTLLIAHSMGSVIAFETLWQLTHVDRAPQAVTLVTMGSPLGQRFIQRRIKGFDKLGKGRYPAGIDHWTNVTAVGDLTAIDPRLAGDFGDMKDLGLVESIEDREIETWFRLDGVLNPHSEYGYFASDGVADIVADWWVRASPVPGSDE